MQRDQLLLAAVGLLHGTWEDAGPGLTTKVAAMAPSAGRSLLLARLAILGGDHRATVAGSPTRRLSIPGADTASPPHPNSPIALFRRT